MLPTQDSEDLEAIMEKSWWRKIILFEWLAVLALTGSALAILFKIYAF